MPDSTSAVEMPEQLGDLQAPPNKRIKDAASALAVCTRLDDEDMAAALNRRAIDAMLDGEQPYDPVAREQQGLGHLANFNSLGASAKEKNALAAYVDLTDAVENPAGFEVESGDPDVDQFVGSVLNEEFGYLHNVVWKGYRPAVLRLATQFIRHGVSVAYRPDEWDWRWEAAGLMDFKLDRDTRVGDQNIKQCKFSDSMFVDELWEKVEDADVAEKTGWNRTECLKAIAQADLTAASGDWSRAADRFQLNVKQNSYGIRSGYGKIRVHKLIVKEFDGTYSFYVVRESGGDDFLYKRERHFEDISHLLTTFTYGVGDGMYHTIRGMGFQIFYQEQALNRSWCNLLDGTDLAGKIVFQPADPNELENMSISHVGPFSIMNCRGSFPNVASPNVNSQVAPVIQMLQREMQVNTGQYRAVPVGETDTKNVTATEYRGRSVEQTVLGSAAMTLFYDPEEAVFNESFRRLINPELRQRDPGGREAFAFRARVMKKLARRGLPWDVVKEVRRVRANRAMGNGSPQMRQNAAQQLLAVSGYFDEAGKNKAVRAYTATIAGVTWQHVDEFVPIGGPRIPQDANIAASQNAAFGSGVPQPVLNTDNQAVHCEIHGDYLWSVAEAMDGNQMDPQRGMPILQEGIQHTLEHMQLLDEDKGHQPEAAATRKLLQNISAVFERWQNHLAAQARKQQQDAQNQPAEATNGPSAEEQQKLQFAAEKHALELRHLDEKHSRTLEQESELFRFRMAENAQHLKTKDLEAAQRIGQENLRTLIANGSQAS